MSNNTEVSYGTKLTYNSAGSTYVEIGDILDMMGPKKKRKWIDTSGLNDAVGTGKPGRPYVSEVTFTMGFSATNFALIDGWFADGSSRLFKITDSGASTEVFLAFVIALERKFPDDEKITCEVTLGITGANTFTP